MTTIDCNDLPVTERRSPTILAGLKAAIERWQERSRRRHALLSLAELDPHLLRDMGLSWEDVDRGILGKHRSVWLEPLSREPSATAPDRYSP